MCVERNVETDTKINWDTWTPTPENINRLPEKLRRYVCSIETMCDPAGIVAENTLLRDELEMIKSAYLDRRIK